MVLDPSYLTEVLRTRRRSRLVARDSRFTIRDSPELNALGALLGLSLLHALLAVPTADRTLGRVYSPVLTWLA